MNRKIRIISIYLVLALNNFCGNAQSTFISRLYEYYDNSTTIKKNRIQLSQDTLIKNSSNFPEFVHFMDSHELWYQDTLLNFHILDIMSPYREKYANLSNQDKNKILKFLCTVMLDTSFANYYGNCADDLFDAMLWNDSIQYDVELKAKLKQIIKEQHQNMGFRAVGFFVQVGLKDLYPDIVNIMIKPYFDTPDYKNTSREVWYPIYYLAKAQNKEVLPYLYKSVAESGCESYDYFDKYGRIVNLLSEVNPLIKKQILLQLLKDNCLTTLYTSPIRRYENPITYFAHIIRILKEMYPNFPIEEIKKLSVPKQVEFVRDWIEKNL